MYRFFLVLHQQLDSKRKNLEACSARIIDLENVIQKHDEFRTLQKRQLNDVKEECHEKLKVDSKKAKSIPNFMHYFLGRRK